MGGGWHVRPRGGGCCGGIVFIIIVIFFLFSMLGNGFTYVDSNSMYDEEKFQDFTNARYEEEFGKSSAYEDNLLLTVLVDDEYYNYYYIAWVGDHIATDINYMLGGNETELGQAMAQCINESSYKYSLDSNLAQVMELMEDQITQLGLESAFTCAEEHAQVTSHVTNRTSMDLTEATINDALTKFTASTGIPVVIVVEDMTDVFGTTVSATSVSKVALIAVVVIVALVAVVIAVVMLRRRKQAGAADDPNARYRAFDDQY